MEHAGAGLEFVDLTFDVPGRGRTIVSGGVANGETVVLKGPSGIGKSTFLSVVCGVQPALSGALRLNGESIEYSAPQARRAGVVFQSHALFPHLNVRDNVAFGLKYAPTTASWSDDLRRRRADEVLASVELEAFGDRDVGALSGGEKGRVAWARALAMEPRFLLLDEAFAALDERLRSRLVQQTLDLVKQKNIPALIVTHDDAHAHGLRMVQWPSNAEGVCRLVF